MTMLRLFFIIAVSFHLFLSGCSEHSPPQDSISPDLPVLKVAVFSDGHLTVDGAAATLETLQQSLRDLSKHHGVVWYYREVAQQEPPPIAMKVMQAVADAKLPVRLSSHADYSDSVGPDGKPIGLR